MGRPPNRRELYYLREALQKLEAGLYGDAEEAMLNGERLNAIPEAAATAVATNDAVPIDQLRAALARILQSELP